MGQRYSGVAILFHWVIALAILLNVALAWVWPNAPDDAVRPMINLHKSVGLTVLGLAVMRLLWRFGHRPPPFPRAYAAWEKALAHIVHWGLYLVMLAMPITGYVMDSAYEKAAATPLPYFGLFSFPRLGFIMALPPEQKKWVHDTFGAAHGSIALAVYALVILHVLGALKHQLQGHRELQRMLPGRG